MIPSSSFFRREGQQQPSGFLPAPVQHSARGRSSQAAGRGTRVPLLLGTLPLAYQLLTEGPPLYDV